MQFLTGNYKKLNDDKRQRLKHDVKLFSLAKITTWLDTNYQQICIIKWHTHSLFHAGAYTTVVISRRQKSLAHKTI